MAVVDNEQVGFMLGRLLHDGQVDVRIDGRRRRVDDFKVSLRILCFKNHFQNSGKTVCRLGKTGRCRAADHEDSVRVGVFVVRYRVRAWNPQQRRREKSQLKLRILDEKRSSVSFLLEKT